MRHLLVVVAVILAGCNGRNQYTPVTYLMWTDRLNEKNVNSNEVIDITDLSEEEVAVLRDNNPNVQFYWTTSAKRFMKPLGKRDLRGFTEKVLLTPVYLAVDGVFLTIVAIVNGSAH